MQGDAARRTDRYSSQFENNYFTQMCSGSEAGSYLRRKHFVYHSTLGWRVIKKKRRCGARISMGGRTWTNRGGLVFEAHRLLYHSA